MQFSRSYMGFLMEQLIEFSAENWKCVQPWVLFSVLVYMPIAFRKLKRRYWGASEIEEYSIKLYRHRKTKLEFAYAIRFGDQILEQNGPVGEIASRVFVDASLLSEVKSRVEQLRQEGFVELKDFGDVYLATLGAKVEDQFASSDELSLRNALGDELDEFLADTGLGSICGASTGEGRMEVDLLLVDYQLAESAIRDFVEGTKYKGFNDLKIEAKVPAADWV